MPTPNGITIRPYRLGDEAAVITRWHASDLVRPWNNPRRDIARKLKVSPEWFLGGELDLPTAPGGGNETGRP